ncbi:acyl-CoA dehydrogenase family protein [Phytohabitans rumicis]|uniref:Acyl-CoA dehydrogenase n=1 Tax=Phytohabitans rumicis TaxID=1076125 RepID=A0A6V8KZA6_9ACTN|nr:acyl-CoA dehydrogenase family protein [Phytohabitans rumicis]GFJ87136.1 acyl-CoA dehydrogenase [Phytohabitans rumicis]
MSPSTTQAPPRVELVRRATKLVPLLREHAPWAEEHRRLHEETIAALADAGVFRMRVPAHHGGYESDAATLHAVLAELGRGDGSVAWTASVWAIAGWMVGMFPDEVQDEVFATPDVRICGTLTPSASATPTAGGMVINGRWSFISGALHSHWQAAMAIAPAPDGVNMWPVVALIPIEELEIVDDWYTSGLRGSGSVSTVATDVLVPAERVLPLPALLAGRTTSVRNTGLPMYQGPLVGVANACSAGTVVGMARAARENFLNRLGSRKITYTDYAHQGEAAITHLQVAEATMKIDEADFHAERMTRLVDTKGVNGEPWTVLDRVRTRADIGAVCQLGRDAVDVLAMASGGSSILSDVPMQRIVRDMHAVNLHALMVPSTNAELYGRVLCGLDPNTQYL